MKDFRIQEVNSEETEILYLEVGSHYERATEGRGKSDAVMFQVGQIRDCRHEIDAIVTCNIEDAKVFAQRILQVCNEIEEK